jgi:hypothetical protein
MLPALVEICNSTLPLFHDAIRKAEAQEVMHDIQSFKRQTESREGGKLYSSVTQGTSVFLTR